MKRTTKKLLTLSQTTIMRPRMLTSEEAARVAGASLPLASGSADPGNGYRSVH
jgi:hypothetical protein